MTKFDIKTNWTYIFHIFLIHPCLLLGRPICRGRLDMSLWPCGHPISFWFQPKSSIDSWGSNLSSHVHCLKIWQTPIAIPRQIRHHIHVFFLGPRKNGTHGPKFDHGDCILMRTGNVSSLHYQIVPQQYLENVPTCWWLNPPNPLKKTWKHT